MAGSVCDWYFKCWIHYIFLNCRIDCMLSHMSMSGLVFLNRMGSSVTKRMHPERFVIFIAMKQRFLSSGPVTSGAASCSKVRKRGDAGRREEQRGGVRDASEMSNSLLRR